MKTKTMNNLAISKLSFFLVIYLIFITNVLLAQQDSLACDVESIVFECRGAAANRAAAEEWHQANIDRLRANCIGQDTVNINQIYSLDLENLSSPPVCNPCYISATYTIVDTIERKLIFNKLVSFTVVDTSPPTFLDVERFDTIECRHSSPIIRWNEGKAAQIRNQAHDCSTITFPYGSYQEEIPSQNEKMSSARYLYEFADIYGNSDTISIILTILDTIPPAISCDPDDLIIECSSQTQNELAAKTWNEENLTKLKNCSIEYCSSISVNSDFDFDSLSDGCGNTGSLDVTYTISDEHNNVITKVATFSIEDSTRPQISCNFGKTTINCFNQLEERLIQIHLERMSLLPQCISDNCNLLSVDSDFDPSVLSEDCVSGPSEFTVNYFVSDICGNTTIETEIFEIVYEEELSTPCDSMEIINNRNIITLSKLSAPNTIAKVFDPNWQIIYNCSGDCPETITIPNLITGETYHTDIQFYDENWQFICEDKRDVLIAGDSEPCDTSICAGDVTLRTQAEVDAFCNCEVIEGGLNIGDSVNGSDINNLKNLSKLRRVNNFISIYNTELTDFSGLNSLEFIEDALIIDGNAQLTSLKGLEALKYINASLVIQFEQNKLISFSSLENLERLGGLSLNNLAIEDLSFFKTIDISRLKKLGISRCDKLTNLEGLNSIQSITTRGQLAIVSNKSLTNISALKNINSINGELAITGNPKLEDCCSIYHLIDDDSTNGFITGNVSIYDNLQFCNSLEDILQHCQSPPLTCEDIQIFTENNQIIIDGLTAPNEIVKVFDKDYNILFECNGNCDDRQITGTFPEGNYVVDLQLYDEKWEFICAEQRPILLESDDEPCDTSICSGRVVLQTQAEIDAFCGCEVIEGDLIIGTGSLLNGGIRTPPTDIVSIANLNNIRKIGGSLIINYTQLEDLTELENLNSIEFTLYLNSNLNLLNLNGLQRIESLDNLNLENNKQITSLAGLDNLESIKNIYLFEASFLDLKDFEYYSNSLEQANISNCNELLSLEGLNLKNLNGQLVISSNDRLSDISAIAGIQEVEDLVIENNKLLSECCTIAHLLDDNLENGLVRGRISIQANPQFCSSPEEILQNCQNISTSCENIQINTENNQITLSNIVAPNAIVKVFNSNWQLIYDCTASCENEIIVSVESEGIYHSDIQFYDKDWKFICEQKQDIEVVDQGEPCDTSICAGDVILQTQAEVDAFCGCEVIDGYLIIGSFDFPTDVHDISNLVNLREIKGRIVIAQTLISNLKGLENLTRIGSFYFFRNHGVKSLQDLKKLQKLNGQLFIDANNSLENLIGLHSIDSLLSIFIWGTEKLNGLDDLNGLRSLSGLFVSGNSIKNLDFVNQLENTKIGLSIAGNREITNLDGLEKFDTLSNLLLGGNDHLSDISALQNLKYITGNLTIEQNPILEDCCSIRHLVDRDTTNGKVLGNVKFGSNGGSNSQCEHVYRLLEQCPNVPVSLCLTTQIQSINNQLSITNLTAPIKILKVFNANYATVYECFADCEESITIPDLVAGTYHININFYDENWQPICEKTESIEIEMDENAQNRNIDFVAGDFILHPNPAQEVTYIDLHKLKGKEAKLALINQFGQEVWQKSIPKVGLEREKIELSTIPNGIYFLQIQNPSRKSISKKLIVNRLY